MRTFPLAVKVHDAVLRQVPPAEVENALLRLGCRGGDVDAAGSQKGEQNQQPSKTESSRNKVNFPLFNR